MNLGFYKMKNKIDKKEIEKFLLSKADKKYQKFSQTLTPYAKNILGVKVPFLKQFAKTLARKHALSCQ